MSKKTPTTLNIRGYADGKDIHLGRIVYNAKTNSSAFQWSDEALAAGVEWSPLRLPLSEKLWVSGVDERELYGLPGLIHDALPDGWGMLLMDRAFQQRGIAKQSITPLLRLAFLADRCWGALGFNPEWGSDITKKQRADLAMLGKEAQQIMEGDTRQVSQAMLVAGGGPHGARPKIMVAVNEDLSHALVGHESIPEGYRHVLIKFSGDRELPTEPLLEYHYTEAARRFGIDTMPACTIMAGQRIGLCVDRFDRQHGQRQHVHSMAGMLHTTHRVANADWTQVAEILQALPGGDVDMAQAFRRAVFNALFVARDDHTKNLSFMRNKDGMWGLSPAYDLCFSTGPGGWHTMSYAGNQKQDITGDDLVRLGESFAVEAADVRQMIEAAQDERQEMLTQAKKAGVASSSLADLRQSFKLVDAAAKPRPARKPR